MNPKARLAVIAAPALLLAIGWYLLVWSGRSDDVAAIDARTETITHQAATLRSQVVDATKFKSGGTQASARLTALRAAYPSDADISGFIRDNDELASQSGALVEALTPEALNNRDRSAPFTTRTVAVSLRVSGAEQAVYDYLGRLQSLKRTTAIDDVDLTAEDAGALTASIRVRIFVAKNDTLGS